MTKHVLLDTDIGGDPDDVFAMLLALGSPEISLDLIVTSDEHKGHRAAFARRILERYQKDIPVVCGSDLSNNKYCLVGDLVEDGATEHYLEAMQRTVEHNSMTEYVCVGPQTNLAAFLICAPHLKNKIHATIMGGALQYRRDGVAEHNIRYDVGAAIEVFNADVKKRYVLSDTTFREELVVNEHHALYALACSSKAKDLLKPSIDLFFSRFFPSTIMHDPLTLATVLTDDFVQFASKYILMNERGIMTESPEGRATNVSISARYGEFMEFLVQRVG